MVESNEENRPFLPCFHSYLKLLVYSELALCGVGVAGKVSSAVNV